MRLPPFATLALLSFAREVMVGEPSQILGADAGDPYLRRWWLSKSALDSVYIHQMLRSDAEEELHDHPAENLSILLDGCMREVTPQGVRVVEPGDIVARSSTDRHRIEIDAPTVSLFVMGERCREWGFWRKPDGTGADFVPASDFFRERGYF